MNLKFCVWGYLLSILFVIYFYDVFVQLPHSASAHVLHSAAGASTPNLIVKDFRPLGVHQAYHHLPHYNNNSVRVAKSSRVMLPKTQLCTLQSYNEDEINNNDLSEVSFAERQVD